LKGRVVDLESFAVGKADGKRSQTNHGVALEILNLQPSHVGGHSFQSDDGGFVVNFGSKDDQPRTVVSGESFSGDLTGHGPQQHLTDANRGKLRRPLRRRRGYATTTGAAAARQEQGDEKENQERNTSRTKHHEMF